MEDTIEEQLLEKFQEVVDRVRRDNAHWGDASEMIALSYVTYAYLERQGWSVREFTKFLCVTEQVIRKMG